MENFFKKIIAGVALIGATEKIAAQTQNPPQLQEKIVNVQNEYLKTELSKIYNEYRKNNEANWDIFLGNKENFKINEDIKNRNKIDSVIEVKSDWLKKYIASSKYQETLLKELKSDSNFVNSHKKGNFSDTLKNIIKTRLSNISNKNKVVVLDSVFNEQSGFQVLGSMEEKNDTIKINKRLFNRDGTNTIIHEEAHQSTSGEDFLLSGTKLEIKKRVREDPIFHNYLNNPTEVHAKLTVLKNILAENLIYNPNEEDFTIDHFKKMLQNPTVMSSTDTRDLFRVVKTVDNLIWLMNNVA